MRYFCSILINSQKYFQHNWNSPLNPKQSLVSLMRFGDRFKGLLNVSNYSSKDILQWVTIRDNAYVSSTVWPSATNPLSPFHIKYSCIGFWEKIFSRHLWNYLENCLSFDHLSTRNILCLYILSCTFFLSPELILTHLKAILYQEPFLEEAVPYWVGPNTRHNGSMQIMCILIITSHASAFLIC